MKNNNILTILERIATALECIAGKDHLSKNIKTENITLSKHRTDQVNTEATEERTHIRSLKIISNFLETRGIQIKTTPQEDQSDDFSDDFINSLSEFLGKNYIGLREFLSQIKRNMHNGHSITLSIRSYSQKEMSNVCQFATRLHEVAFLEEYKYLKSPKYLIEARTTTLPAAQNFFSGIWLERFVLISVKKVIDLLSCESNKDISFSYLLNPQITLPNGDDFELDLIFQVNGLIYWIESKSGDYQQHIGKYSKMAKLLNLDFKHSIIVLTNITSDRSKALTSLFSMTVSSLSGLEERLIKTIKEDVQA